MTVPENRAVLVRMAQAWHQLAQANEQTEQPVDSHNESSMEAC
jgi:hypothetical protein